MIFCLGSTIFNNKQPAFLQTYDSCVSFRVCFKLPSPTSSIETLVKGLVSVESGDKSLCLMEEISSTSLLKAFGVCPYQSSNLWIKFFVFFVRKYPILLWSLVDMFMANICKSKQIIHIFQLGEFSKRSKIDQPIWFFDSRIFMIVDSTKSNCFLAFFTCLACYMGIN